MNTSNATTNATSAEDTVSQASDLWHLPWPPQGSAVRETMGDRQGAEFDNLIGPLQCSPSLEEFAGTCGEGRGVSRFAFSEHAAFSRHFCGVSRDPATYN